MEFYRGDKNIIFKLKDLEVVDDFKLWLGWKQTMTDEESVAAYGIVLNFPIRDGMLPGVDGTPRDVQSVIKYMKRVDFLAQYPKLGKRTQYIRNVIINGVEYRYGFSKTVNDKLNAMLALSPGVLPNVSFKQSFDKNKAAAAMYDLIVATADEVGAQVAPAPQNLTAPGTPVAPVPTQPVAQPQAVSPPQSPPAPKVGTPLSTGGLSDGEKTILASIKGLPNKLTQEQFIKIFTKNLSKPEFGGIATNVASQRALAIFDSQYK